MFVLETLAKSMVKKEGVSEESANEQQLKELNVVKTLDYIKNAHGDQLYGKLPYWTHPRAVALTGRKIFGNKFTPDAVKTAFLHDVIEDTNTSLSELAKLGFSTQVINAVGLLTKDNTLSYEQNIKKIIQSGNPLAMMVKYADNTENFGGDKSAMSSDRRNRLQTKYRASLDMLAQALGIDT
jgi:(p)ppGpp synthase/HD superfamily hydrolase